MQNRVEIQLYGKRALVDADQVDLVLEKEDVVLQIQNLELIAATLPAAEHLRRMDELVDKIFSLNKRIRRNIEFI